VTTTEEGAVKRLTVLCIAVAVGLTACGGNTDTEGSAQQTKPRGNQPPEEAQPAPEAESSPQEARPTPKAEPETGERRSREEERVADAQRRILDYCAEPASRVENRKDDAISALVRIAREKPEVAIGANSMVNVLDNTATLLAECDKDGARRLTRAARSLR
jgi:hypothetical protein